MERVAPRRNRAAEHNYAAMTENRRFGPQQLQERRPGTRAEQTDVPDAAAISTSAESW
jgi:hypothetical protein